MKRNERKPRMHQWRLLKLHTFVLTSALVCRNLLKHFFVTIFSSKFFDYSSRRPLVRITRGQYDCSSVLYATFLHTKSSLKNWLFQSTNIILKTGANEKNWILTGFATMKLFFHFLTFHVDSWTTRVQNYRALLTDPRKGAYKMKRMTAAMCIRLLLINTELV